MTGKRFRPEPSPRRLAALGEWLLVDVLGEIVLAVAVCGLIIWGWAAFRAGWEDHRGLTLIAAGLFVAFLGYGAWSILVGATARAPRWPRLAMTAILAVVLLATYSVYLVHPT